MFWIGLFAIILLWLIERRLASIEHAIKTLRLTVEIPIDDGGGSDQPKEKPRVVGNNVVALRK
jgi:hypothetical protein